MINLKNRRGERGRRKFSPSSMDLGKEARVRLFAIKITRGPTGDTVDVLYKMGKGKVIRSKADRKVGAVLSEVLEKVMEALKVKGILGG